MTDCADPPSFLWFESRLVEVFARCALKAFTARTPSRSWEETREAYGNRLKRCCDQINKDLKVEEPCGAFPKRIRLLKEKVGGRLRW